jgi:hypothetical protein
MTTEKQVAANRQNAQSSTGPTSEDGKAASRLNALKHGLTAETPVLPTEDEATHGRFRAALLDDLAPVGATEELLADEIADLSWRLRRATTVELGVFARGVAIADERFYLAQRRQFEVWEEDVLAMMHRDALGMSEGLIQVTNEHLHDFRSELVDDAASEKRTDEARLGEAFVDDAARPNAITKLARHETSLFRRRNQALDALAAAQGARVEAPVKEAGPVRRDADESQPRLAG